jgi:coproporphyrinogen III oxidase
MNAKRQRGHKVLQTSDVLLMARGRYAEAARVIYDRGYSSGWQTAKKQHRQLPARELRKVS